MLEITRYQNIGKKKKGRKIYMKKYLLLAILCAFWPSTLLLGCTGATGPGNSNTGAAHTGNNTSGFTGTCIGSFAAASSPVISSVAVINDNTVTIEWQWQGSPNAVNPAIVIEYSLDNGVNWNYLASTNILSGNPATSYTSSVLQPGTYTFKVGSYSYNTPTTAYFSNPSTPITIAGGSNPYITINPIPEMYVGKVQQISGTFDNSFYCNFSAPTTTIKVEVFKVEVFKNAVLVSSQDAYIPFNCSGSYFSTFTPNEEGKYLITSTLQISTFTISSTKFISNAIIQQQLNTCLWQS